LERLWQSTSSFSLTKPDALSPSYGIKARQVWEKILVSCGQGKQMPEMVFRLLERMKHVPQMPGFFIVL